jgi:hypothetical protein
MRRAVGSDGRPPAAGSGPRGWWGGRAPLLVAAARRAVMGLVGLAGAAPRWGRAGCPVRAAPQVPIGAWSTAGSPTSQVLRAGLTTSRSASSTESPPPPARRGSASPAWRFRSRSPGHGR